MCIYIYIFEFMSSSKRKYILLFTKIALKYIKLILYKIFKYLDYIPRKRNTINRILDYFKSFLVAFPTDSIL